MTLHAIRLYEKLRLYQPLGFLFQPEANMPSGVTAEMPSCLLCGRRSNLPPAKVGYLRGDEPRLFQICGDCGFDHSDGELERKIIALVSGPAIAAE